MAKQLRITDTIKRPFLQILVFMLFILVWEMITKLFHTSELLLPSPLVVKNTYLHMLFNGLLLEHTKVTVIEVVCGFTIGGAVGVILGYLLGKSKLLEDTLSPYIIALQTTPKLALAPLFLIWFGFGITSKILITALIVFFAIFINMLVAVKSVNSNLKDLLKLNQANQWQVFTKLELPSSLPFLFAGFKSGITLAVIGAVVGEFIGANSGLGYLIIFSMGNLNTPAVYASIIQLIILGVVFYQIISVIGRRLMHWHESEKDIY